MREIVNSSEGWLIHLRWQLFPTSADQCGHNTEHCYNLLVLLIMWCVQRRPSLLLNSNTHVHTYVHTCTCTNIHVHKNDTYIHPVLECGNDSIMTTYNYTCTYYDYYMASYKLEDLTKTILISTVNQIQSS